MENSGTPVNETPGTGTRPDLSPPPGTVVVPPRPTGDMVRALAAHERRSTLRSGTAWLTLLIVMTISIVADLSSKSLAFKHVAGEPVVLERANVLSHSARDPRAVTEVIPPHPPMVVVPHVLEFSLVLNPGAVFGMGPGQRWFFIGFTALALLFGVWMFLKWTGPDDRWAHVGIAMLLGGGLGNLYDRLTYACVRDFIHPLPGLKWPFGLSVMGNREVWPYVSNLADLILLIGIVMLLVILWKRDKQPR